MKDLRLPVEVDAPSEARWDRIGRELFAKLDASPPDARALEHGRTGRARRRWVAWGGGAAAVAAAALAVATLAHSRHVPGADPRARLETTDGASRFTVGESSLLVAPRSLVMVEGDDEHGIDVVLDRGSVTCIVAPRRGRPAFVVDAGDVRVQVVGTKFTVTRGAEGTSVDVDRGVVEVAARGVVTTLHDGEHWAARPEGVAPADSSPVGAPASTSPSAAAPPVSEPAPVAPRAPRPTAPRDPASLARSGAPAGDGPTQGSVASAVAAPPLAGPSPQEQFEVAAKIERARPDDAMGIYRQLAAGGAAWAPNALFALARLEADRGRAGDASRHLQEYLSRYPRGINADDARALLDRLR